MIFLPKLLRDGFSKAGDTKEIELNGHINLQFHSKVIHLERKHIRFVKVEFQTFSFYLTNIKTQQPQQQEQE